MTAFVSTVAALLLALVLAVKLRSERAFSRQLADEVIVQADEIDAVRHDLAEAQRQCEVVKRLYWAATDASCDGRELPKPDAIEPVPLPPRPNPWLMSRNRREESA